MGIRGYKDRQQTEAMEAPSRRRIGREGRRETYLHQLHVRLLVLMHGLVNNTGPLVKGLRSHQEGRQMLRLGTIGYLEQ